MKPQTQPELAELLINWVRENKLKNGSANLEITPETNLLERGILDSLGFVELILFLESESGLRVDLFEANPAEFTKIGGLCRIAVNSNAQQSV